MSDEEDASGQQNEGSATLADTIRAAREAAGLSLRQLSPLVGLDFSVLSRIEAGKVTRPSPEVLQNIAEVLELDASELLAFVGVKATLPEPKVYFRKAYGMTEDEAIEAARLIEERYGSSPHTKITPTGE
jgi:transcriptional regulator with XRE-family HTH domain